MKLSLIAIVFVACTPVARPDPEPARIPTAWRTPEPVVETVDGPSDRLCHEQFGRDEMAIQELIDANKLTPSDIEFQRGVIAKRRADCARRYGDPR